MLLAILAQASAPRSAVTLVAVLVALLPFIPLVMKMLDFIKLVTNKDVNGILTQVCSWAIALVVVFAVVNSNFSLGGALDHLNIYSQILAALVLGSGGSFVYDYIKARDNMNTAAMPPLIPGYVSDRPVLPPLVVNVPLPAPLVTSMSSTGSGSVSSGQPETEPLGPPAARRRRSTSARKRL